MIAIALPPDADALLEDLAQRRVIEPKAVALSAVLEWLEDELNFRCGTISKKKSERVKNSLFHCLQQEPIRPCPKQGCSQQARRQHEVGS